MGCMRSNMLLIIHAVNAAVVLGGQGSRMCKQDYYQYN